MPSTTAGDEYGYKGNVTCHFNLPLSARSAQNSGGIKVPDNTSPFHIAGALKIMVLPPLSSDGLTLIKRGSSNGAGISSGQDVLLAPANQDAI